MFDGVYRDWEPNRPQAPSERGLWLLVSLLVALPVVLVMLSIAAAVPHPQAFPGGFGRQF